MRSYLNLFSRCKLRPGRKGSGEVLDDIRKNRVTGMPSEAIELSFALRAHLRWIFGETAYPGKFTVLMEHTPLSVFRREGSLEERKRFRWDFRSPEDLPVGSYLDFLFRCNQLIHLKDSGEILHDSGQRAPAECTSISPALPLKWIIYLEFRFVSIFPTNPIYPVPYWFPDGVPNFLYSLPSILK